MTDRVENRLRWGVLGSSGYISTLVVPAVLASPTGTLRAVATRGDGSDPTTRLAVGHGARLAASYADVVTAPDVDAVYVPLPNTLHVPWALAAVEAGKHVLVEKPLATTQDDVRRVLDAARANGVSVMEAFMYRFHPQHRRVREIVASGRIGDVQGVRSSFAFRIDDPGNIRLRPELGGGATWDVGCYATEVALWFLDDEPSGVRSVVHRRPGTGVDTTVAAVLEFPHGRFATIDYSIDHGQQASYEVQGTHGSVRVENAWATAQDAATLHVRAHDGAVTREVLPVTDHYLAQVTAFERAVLAGEPVPFPPEASLRNVRTLEAVLAAASVPA